MEPEGTKELAGINHMVDFEESNGGGDTLDVDKLQLGPKKLSAFSFGDENLQFQKEGLIADIEGGLTER